MKKRFFATTVVAITVLLSPSVSVVVAGLCQHLQSNQASCHTRSAETAASHHDMAHMQMDLETEAFSVSSNNEIGFLVNSRRFCTHCAVHSRTGGGIGSLQQSAIANHSHELTPLITESPRRSVLAGEGLKLPLRAHGPPGDASSKHVLISVFRI